jgi:hypothetical protein
VRTRAARSGSTPEIADGYGKGYQSWEVLNDGHKLGILSSPYILYHLHELKNPDNLDDSVSFGVYAKESNIC